VKETSMNGDICVRFLFGSGSCTFFTFPIWFGSVRFLAKPGFWIGSFLLGLSYFPSL